MKKNKLSYSAVEKFLECPRKFDLHYNKRLREKVTGSSLIFGSAFGSALDAFFIAPSDKPKAKGTPREVFDSLMEKQEINGVLEDIKTTENVKFLKSDWDVDVLSENDLEELINEKIIVETLEKPIRESATDIFFNGGGRTHRYLSWYSLKAKGRLFLEIFEKDILPNIKRVLYTEKRIYFKNQDGDEFEGYADIIAEWIDGRIICFDFKTASKAYDKNAVKESKQLATYYIGCEDLKIDAIGFIVFEKNIRKREPRVRTQILIDKPDQKLLESTYETYDKVNYLIKQGNYPQNKESCITVYGKCSYWNYCHGNSMNGLVDKSKDKK